ncbi:MAG: hypothetical protein RBS72_04755 [Sedimentisphaerales bacterium]|nr:hypothetical protein [Sedimentisphaerales bacterium]HNY77522.1 hypothetical protein [Sedimentisphaerales bacterium]HOC62926.1 hypothetical protein [Sedimentisphaerales bacterium]HOH63588.1 hypothetical protein [Sedimentisphaerales bacterium]HPY48635.1 hypothetical protein [Sedimentisphaerales bacterium]
MTDRICSQKISLGHTLRSRRTEKVLQTRRDIACREFLEFSQIIRQSHVFRGNVDANLMRSLPGDTGLRLTQILKIIDTFDIHDMALRQIREDRISDKSRFCSSPDWMAWHHVRLTLALVQEYHYMRSVGGDPAQQRAEHDYQDMEYVLLLSRADAVITQDKRLAALARAAFPEKDVFSGLEEVPDSYRCDWAGL